MEQFARRPSSAGASPPPGERRQPDGGPEPAAEPGACDAEVDEASEETFPASDAPPFWFGPHDHARR